MAADLKGYDLHVAAANGLRRGFTTGSCATAAVKAALTLFQYDIVSSHVNISMPDGEHFLTIAVKSVEKIGDTKFRADVVKDAGDDPDCTHGATIFAIIEPNENGRIIFKAGDGVGTVTEPGIRVAVGEPAINPGPREMICLAIKEVFADDYHPGFDVTIGCVEGLALAKKTFNPRLGIEGGISILGTTGIVEPMSLAAYMAAIEVYIEVSVGENEESVAFLPGNIGQRFCREEIGLPKKRVVNISNFLGFSLQTLDQILLRSDKSLETLWLLGHPGKIAKVLAGHFDLHSSKSGMAMPALAALWRSLNVNLDEALLHAVEVANTVEAVAQILAARDSGEFDGADLPRSSSSISPSGDILWRQAEIASAKLVKAQLTRVNNVEVRLFNMRGVALCKP